ncbi:hypothetical protein Tco_1516427 [Tanacetum coccineum]
MSNNLQTNTTSAIYNAIMEAGSKDRPPMLAPDCYSYYTYAPPTRKERVKETYATILEETRKKIDAEAEVLHIIFTRIDNDIYSTVDACPNAEKMWKAIEHLKQGENINKHDVETNLYREFGKFTSKDGETLESYYSRMAKTSINKSPGATRSKGKEITKAHSPHESDHEVISDEQETQRDKEIHKLMALISTFFKKIYKPTNNNLITSSNTKNKNVDNTVWSDKRIGFNCKEFGSVAKECKKAKRPRDSSYHKEKRLMCKQHEAGIQISAEQHDWVQDSDEEEDQELEAHVCISKIQEVTTAAKADNGPIFDKEPLEKVHPNDDYNVFATER